MGGGRGGVGVLSNFCASAPHSHSFSSLLTTSCSWSMTHLCIIIWNSWEKEMYQFKGNPCLPKWKKIPEQNTTRNLFPVLLLLYLVQLLHFELEQSFSLSITISVGEPLPKRRACAGGRSEGWRAGVSGWVLDSGLWSACTRESFCLSWGCCVYLPLAGVCRHCSAGCCWKCLCLCVFRSVSLCVLVCIRFPTLLVTAKRDMAERRYYQVGTVHRRGCDAHKTTCFRKSLEKILLEKLMDRFVHHFWRPAAMVHVKLPSKHLQYFPWTWRAQGSASARTPNL